MGLFTGKTVIITGGGRAVLRDGSCGSIGYGIATAYAKEGANIVVTGRNVKKLEDAKEELERLYGVKVLPVQADVSADADNEAVVANVVKKTIDTLDHGLVAHGPDPAGPHRPASSGGGVGGAAAEPAPAGGVWLPGGGLRRRRTDRAPGPLRRGRGGY